MPGFAIGNGSHISFNKMGFFSPFLDWFIFEEVLRGLFESRQ